MKTLTIATLLTALSLPAAAFAQAPSRGRNAPSQTDRRVPPYRGNDTAPAPQRRRDDRIPSVTSYAPHYGVAGTTVTIRGQNFSSGTKVIYGGVTVSPTRLSSSSISFVVPARLGDATISLDVPTSRRPLAVGSFDLRPAPRPTRPTYEKPAGTWNRPARKTSSVRSIQARWKAAFLASPGAKSELALHAERMADLRRMLRLAQSGYPQLVVRINAAISREDTRHERKMTQLETNYRRG